MRGCFFFFMSLHTYFNQRSNSLLFLKKNTGRFHIGLNIRSSQFHTLFILCDDDLGQSGFHNTCYFVSYVGDT